MDKIIAKYLCNWGSCVEPKDDGFIIVCHSGSLQLCHFGVWRTLRSKDTAVVMPGDIYSFGKATAGCIVSQILFSQAVIDGMSFSMPQNIFKQIAQHPSYALSSQSDYDVLVGYIKILQLTLERERAIYLRETRFSLIRTILLEVCNSQARAMEGKCSGADYRNRVLGTFIELVKANPQCREVAFFADKLSVSPKYLSAIVSHGAGCNAKEYIERAAVDKIKIMLSNTHLTVEQIADKLKFSGKGNLCRFFKTNTGMTISEFKQQKPSEPNL